MRYYWSKMTNEERDMIKEWFNIIKQTIRKMANKKASYIKINKFSDQDEVEYQQKLIELQNKYNEMNIYEICPECGVEFHLDNNKLKQVFKDNDKLLFCSVKCSGKYYANKQHSEETDEQKIVKNKKISETLKARDNTLTAEQFKQKILTLNKYWNELTTEERSARNKKNAIKSKQTKLKRYGDENYNNKNKISETYKKNNTVDNPAQNWAHISSDNLKIIRDKNLFKQYILNIPIEDRCIFTVADGLGISRSYCSTLINQYDLYQDDDFKIHRNLSKPQKLLEEYIKQLYAGTIIINDRQTIKPFELDIYIPEKQLAIEYNGNYYHSVVNVDKKSHYNKSMLCEKLGIRLIHIFEYEWEDDRQRPILENIIKSALGITEIVYARKLKIEERPSSSMQDFFNQNNIQGFRGGKTAICLVDENTNEVYMSYIMGDAFFGKGKYQWEVIRGATKLGYTVVGGASKIWKYFIEKYNPDTCVYYIDYNYFNGKSLENLPHMEFIKTQYGFKNYWVNEGKVKNREPFRHKEIKELEAQGLVYPIYNAGTKVYVWKKEV